MADLKRNARRHDPIALPPFGRMLASGIAGARYVEFDDASHALLIQCAERLNALLLEHLTAQIRQSRNRHALTVERPVELV